MSLVAAQVDAAGSARRQCGRTACGTPAELTEVAFATSNVAYAAVFRVGERVGTDGGTGERSAFTGEDLGIDGTGIEADSGVVAAGCE